MKPTKKIEAIKRVLINLFGEDDAVIRAVELKERYLEIGLEFERVREFKNYEIALRYVSNEFHVSESTAKRAIAFTETLVHENELNKG